MNAECETINVKEECVTVDVKEEYVAEDPVDRKKCIQQ